MKRVLLDNAYEAWAMAIKYCHLLAEGIATLPVQKHFVSSLHNAVELFLKQMMIDAGDHDVASVRRIKTLDDAQLALRYMTENDLNKFFSSLSSQELDKFSSIEFGSLIDKHKSIIKDGLNGQTLKIELKLLQELRNNETHFLITESNFLTENDFQTLHNFMIMFYDVIKTAGFMPFWGETFGEDERLIFKGAALTTFSYKNALQKSSLALKVADALNGSYEYGDPGCSAYDIAYSLCMSNEKFGYQFDKIWPIIEMFIRFNMIEYEEIIEEIPEELEHFNRNPNVYYCMSVDIQK